MDKLPILDIQSDISNLDSDNEEVEIVCEDLSLPLELSKPKDIFIGKPTNKQVKKPMLESVKKRKIVSKREIEIPTQLKTAPAVADDFVDKTDQIEDIEDIKVRKKPLSEKQRLHLERIRVKALESKIEKSRIKKEIKHRVETEVKTERKKQKEKKSEVVVEEKLSEDFKERLKVPSDEEKARKKIEMENHSFTNFMSNMEKYKVMKFQYKSQQERKSQPKSQPTQERKSQPKPQPTQKPLPPTIIPKKPISEYDSIFEW